MSATVNRIAHRLQGLEARVRLGPPVTGSTVASRRVLSTGARWLAIGVALQSLGHIVDYVALDLRIQALDVDQEYSFTAWAGTAITFVSAWLIAEAIVASGRTPWTLLALAAVIAFLSLDDMISIHERVVLFDPEGNSLRYLNRIFWPAVYGPLLIFAFGGLWLLAACLEPAARRMVRIGLYLLGFSLVLEAAGSGILLAGSTRSELPYNVEVLIEEAAELGGWGLIALGIASWKYRPGAPDEEAAEAPAVAAEQRAAVPGP